MPPALDPQLLALENYPYQHQLETQFGDMDALAHINNVTLAKYYESVRTRFFMECFEDTDLYSKESLSFVIVELNIKFLGETHFPQAVTIGTAVEKIGNSSLFTKQVLFQSGQCVGLCDTSMVLVKDSKPLVIPNNLRECVGQYQLQCN